MKQARIKSVNDGIVQCDKAVGGVTQHGAAIGIHRHTAANITADKDALITQRDTVNVAKAELTNRQSVLRPSIVVATDFNNLARDLLKPSLGRQYSTAWAVAGFNSSLKIPRTFNGLAALTHGVGAYLTANAAMERPELNITAERALEIYNDLLAKANAVNAQKAVLRGATASKKTAFKAVVKRLSGLTKELSDLMTPLDTRWLAFGLNMPGAVAIPSVPANLSAVLTGTSASLKWDAAARAERYRIYMKVLGVDADFVFVSTREALDLMIEGLPVNSTIEFAVSAMNSSGESVKSQAVTVVTQ